MINVLFNIESHYPVDRQNVKNAIINYLKGKVKRKTEVSVFVVGNRKINSLNKKYRNLDKVTDVLSFSLTESKESGNDFIEQPDKVLRLGDVVISYPMARNMAYKENLMVDDAIIKLALHGIDHLLGIHHPE